MSAKFFDLPADAYPFTMAFIRTDNNKVVDVITVKEPGEIRIRPYADEEGVPVRVRITLCDGTVTYTDPR